MILSKIILRMKKVRSLLKVTDLTRDKITSGEAAWKKLTDTEKQAVNQLILQKVENIRMNNF